MLAGAGVDLLELSGGSYENTAFFHGHRRPAGANGVPSDERQAFFLQFATRARAVTQIPLMLTGGIRTQEMIDTVLRTVGIDVVGLARPFALTPHLGHALLAGTLSRIDATEPRCWPTAITGTAIGGFYDLQMRRLGQNKLPRCDDGAWRSALHLVWRELSLALSARNRAPLRPAASGGP